MLQAAIFAGRLFELATHSNKDTDLPFAPEPFDRRFADPVWQRVPFVIWQQAFLAQKEWWRSATRLVRGQNATSVAFMVRQLLDGLSPSNVPWLNPLIIERTLNEFSFNFVRGARNSFEDYFRIGNRAVGHSHDGKQGNQRTVIEISSAEDGFGHRAALYSTINSPIGGKFVPRDLRVETTTGINLRRFVKLSGTEREPSSIVSLQK